MQQYKFRVNGNPVTVDSWDPPNAVPNLRVVSHLRLPGKITNAFPVESFADELAAAAGMDPVGFRLRRVPFTTERVKAAFAKA